MSFFEVILFDAVAAIWLKDILDMLYDIRKNLRLKKINLKLSNLFKFPLHAWRADH